MKTVQSKRSMRRVTDPDVIAVIERQELGCPMGGKDATGYWVYSDLATDRSAEFEANLAAQLSANKG